MISVISHYHPSFSHTPGGVGIFLSNFFHAQHICQHAIAAYSNNCFYGNATGDFSPTVVHPVGADTSVTADPRLASYAFGNLHIEIRRS